VRNVEFDLGKSSACFGPTQKNSGVGFALNHSTQFNFARATD
jgi:hypothetical protein